MQKSEKQDKKAKENSFGREYFIKQKKLVKETLRKFAKHTAKKIDKMLE